MKKRLDVLVAERGLAPSREKAKALIMSGAVSVNGVREDKPGASFREGDELRIEVTGEVPRYVSRGGLKLEKALRVFDIDLKGLVTMDIGASTGGFTDCMLSFGASLVYAVDVGYGQFAWSLRNDPRVILMERTNARYLTGDDIGGARIDFAAVDVSFISLDKILPALSMLLADDAGAVLLIKPQFEAGREEIGKNGVVRDISVHRQVIARVIDNAGGVGLFPAGLSFSPVRGPKGNIEYLLYLTVREREDMDYDLICRVTSEAHALLNE